MRLILDITKTRAGRYQGRLTVPGSGAQHEFAGILELLAILEGSSGQKTPGKPGLETVPSQTRSPMKRLVVTADGRADTACRDGGRPGTEPVPGGAGTPVGAVSDWLDYGS